MTDTIAKQTESEVEHYACAWCDGDGTVPELMGEENQDGPRVECSHCAGTGEAGDE